jgi:hypothetical protein
MTRNGALIARPWPKICPSTRSSPPLSKPFAPTHDSCCRPQPAQANPRKSHKCFWTTISREVGRSSCSNLADLRTRMLARRVANERQVRLGRRGGYQNSARPRLLGENPNSFRYRRGSLTPNAGRSTAAWRRCARPSTNFTNDTSTAISVLLVPSTFRPATGLTCDFWSCLLPSIPQRWKNTFIPVGS